MEDQVFYYPEYDYTPFYPQPAAVTKTASPRLVKAAFVLAIVGLLLVLLPIVSTRAINYFSNHANATISDLNSERLLASGEEEANLPPKDASLPAEPTLKINQIGLNTTVYQYPFERYEEALEQGVWMPLDFGTPMSSDVPVILAAHRFGYLKWTNQFRREHSFYNLPKLTEGDRVTFIWHQREFKYEIYKMEKGTDITDYDADLILYTCNDLVSDIRIFAYAKRV